MIKQKLLATTALVSLVAGSAFAGGPAPSMHNDMSVKIGGMYDAKVVVKDSKHDGATFLTLNNRGIGIDTDAQVFIEAKNSTAKGLEYGAHIGLSTNTVASKQPQRGIDRSFLWMEHADMGRVEFGSNNDASESMRQGADRIATATGGIAGSWFKILSEEAFGSTISLHEFHLKPWSVGDNKLNLVLASTATGENNVHAEKARKINYYSPKVNGFHVGLSYMADSENQGSNGSSMPNPAITPGREGGNYDVFSGGVAWDGRISNDIDASFSVVGMKGRTRSGGNNAIRPSEDISSVDVGGMISYNKLKAAASYGYTGKSGFLKNTTGLALKKGWYATAGLSYEFDKLVASITYLHGNKNKNTSGVFSLGADYHLASGIMPYAEVTHYNLKLKQTGGLSLNEDGGNANHSASDTLTIAAASGTTKTDGTAFILGTKLSF